MNCCIAILSYNHPDLTAKTVNSALKFNLPVYLIHNGSIPKHISFLQKEFPNINHLIQENNKGYSGGVNFAFTSLTPIFDWIYFLTNDTELLTLPNQLPDIGYYAAKTFSRKINKIDSIGALFYPHQAQLIHIKDDVRISINNKNCFFYVPGSAFLIHKKVISTVGLIDESLHTYWEDVDYSVRVAKAGFKLAVLDHFTLSHKIGKTCHDNPFYTTYLFKRNQLRVSKKYSTFLGKLNLFAFFISDFCKINLKCIKTKNWTRLNLYYKALKDI